LSLLAFGYVALAGPTPSLPVNPGGIGGLYKGPNSETIIKGPDGSVITSAVEGGEIQTGIQPIVVAEPAVAVETPAVAVAAPVATPVEAVAVPAPVVESAQSSDLIGPSGRILTQGSQSVVAGPASTTVTGPAVVAETIVKGPPIVASPVLNAAVPVAAPVAAVTASPLATLTGAIAPISVTAAPIATITSAGWSPVSVTPTPIATIAEAELSPISVTASPIATITGADIASVSLPALSVASGVGLGAVAPVQLAGAALGAPIATVTVAPPQAVATASASPQLSVASASSSTHGASATASAAPNEATASVQAGGNVRTVSVTASPLPVITSTVLPAVVNNGIQGLGDRRLVGINDQVDLRGPQLVQDQLAVDNRQLTLNPALIPSGNIIPPEIGIATRGPVNGRLRPRPGDILTTPGLGSVATSTNIQREEVDATLRATPNTLQIGVNSGPTPEQAIALQNQQIWLNNQIQNVQQAGDPRLVNPNPQIVNITPKNEILVGPPVDPRLKPNGRQVATLANVQQRGILNTELAKSGIDASQLQLTNVPLSAVSTLPVQLTNPVDLKGSAINDGLPAEAWGRY
ncbi:uncharacterized protein BDFB_010569, partial [Asbolus verrucosus]